MIEAAAIIGWVLAGFFGWYLGIRVSGGGFYAADVLMLPLAAMMGPLAIAVALAWKALNKWP